MSKTSEAIREGADQFGKYWEEKTGNGWRKFRRERNGITFAVYGSKTDDYINALLANKIHTRLNEMSDRVELKDKGPLTDIQESVILNRLTDCDMKNTDRMRRAIHEAAHRERYHPVREYLDAITWDGKDHLQAFLNKLDMSSKLANVFWKKFLIGSIAKAIDGAQNFMLVLVGGQGKGKSRLVRWLCPLPELFNEGPVSPDNKDDLIMLLNNWIWEVSELDSTTRRADRSALKHFISLKNVKVRVPYGRYPVDKPAAASMIGTVNEDGTGFLNDPSGNRRFGVVQLVGIDWSYEAINRDQLWAQLYQMYKDGESHELTKHEQEVQNEMNLEYTLQSPLEELFLSFFEYDKSQPERFMSTMDILSHLSDLGLEGRQYTNKIELASVMTKLGIEQTRGRVDGKQVRGYAGVWVETKIAQMGKL
jgi:predicted P-loop ATPase